MQQRKERTVLVDSAITKPIQWPYNQNHAVLLWFALFAQKEGDIFYVYGMTESSAILLGVSNVAGHSVTGSGETISAPAYFLKRSFNGGDGVCNVKTGKVKQKKIPGRFH